MYKNIYKYIDIYLLQHIHNAKKGLGLQ